MASKNEKEAAKRGISLKEYKKSKGKKSKKKSKKNDSYKDIIDSVLKATPAQQEVLPDFETTYTPELEAEDLAQSEALYTPYFEQQIANELEDLNAWSEAESISYDRSLRRARISLASQGGAIGEGTNGERQTQEGEMATDREADRQNTIRGVERNIGTARLTGAGFKSTGQSQEGAIVGKLKGAIQEGQLWYKNQRAQRYYGNAQTYYQQPSAYSLTGSKL